MPDLRELQALVWQAIAAAPGPCGGPEPPAALVDAVLPGPRLAPAARVAIYSGMYFWRLFEVLKNDFPRVAARAGDAFEALVAGYLARHPSMSPSVRDLGRRFPGWLADAARDGLPPWLADLARLEWARVEAFDAPDAEPLRAGDVAGLPAEEWPGLRLGLVPAALRVDAAWPVHRLWDADGPADVAPAATALRVWRQGFAVYHASMDALEAAAFDRVAAGATFAEVCECCATADEAVALLARWLEDGLVSRL